MADNARRFALSPIRPTLIAMPNYRRAFVPGGTWFFTVNLLERNKRLLIEHIGMLREAIARVRTGRPFAIDAIVILPDHLHAVLTLPQDDADFATRGRLIKTRFAKALPATERLSPTRVAPASAASGDGAIGST